MRKVALESWLVPAFFLVACAPGRAPLPPDASLYPLDEAHDAFGMKLPGDATHVAVPAWASLEAAWGSYDPPFTNPLNGPKTVVFGNDDRLLVILGNRGQVRVWDRARRETVWRSDACERRASTPETAQDEAQLYLSSGDLAAIGFRSTFFCVMDARTGRKVVDIQAHDMKWNGSTTFLARLVGSRLVTYAYRSPESYPLGDGSTRNIEQAGGELRTWDARTGRMLSTVHVSGFAAAALSPDGTLFAAGDGTGLRLRDVTGRVLWTSREKLHQLSFATNDHLLALRGAQLVDVDAKDGTVRPFPQGYFGSSDEAPYRGVFPSRDGRQALTVLEYGRLMLWDVAARAEVSHALLQWGTSGWAGSPTGAMFVAPGAVVVSAKTLAVIEQPKGPVRFVTLSGSGDRALASRDRAPRPVQFWDATARTVAEWKNPNEAYMELASDGARVLVRESERNLLREVATGRVLVNESGHIWTSAALSHDGTRMAHFTWDAQRKAYDTLLRDTRTGAILWRNAGEKPADPILAFDASGQKLLISDYDHQVTFLSTHNGAVLARLGPAPALKEIHLGDDFALVDDAEGLAVVDLATWRPRFRVVQRTFPRGMALPRSAAYFWEFDGTLVWRRSLTTGDPIGAPIDLAPSDDEPRAIATSSDGKILMVGTERGVLLRFRVKG